MGDSLKSKIIADLQRSRKHLEYSFNKVRMMNFDRSFDEQGLETLESFASRFSRFSDLAIKQWLSFLARESDPGFRGSIIDLLNLAEKSGWIGSATEWRRIRELRNLAAHEYSAEDFKELYRELVAKTPILFALKIDA